MPSKLIKQLLGFGFLLLPTLILAQSIPNGGSITFDQIWSATEWATAWQSKVDVAALGVTIPTYPQTAAEAGASVVPVNYIYVAGNALRYGADPTGAADSTSALTNCHKIGLVCYYPTGTYKISSGIPIACGGIVGDGSGLTVINTTSTSGSNLYAFSCSSAGRFEKFTINGASMTGGYAITVTAPSGENTLTVFRDVYFNATYKGISFIAASHWVVDASIFRNMTGDGLTVNNTNIADSGDSAVTNCTFENDTQSGTATGINQIEEGGLKIIGNKFNGPNIGYAMNLGTSSTGVLVIDGNSFENMNTEPIVFNRATGSAFFQNVTITGNEFLDTQGLGIVSNPSSNFLINVVISSNVFVISPTSVNAVIYLAYVNGLNIVGNTAWSAATSSGNFIELLPGNTNVSLSSNTATGFSIPYNAAALAYIQSTAAGTFACTSGGCTASYNRGFTGAPTRSSAGIYVLTYSYAATYSCTVSPVGAAVGMIGALSGQNTNTVTVGTSVGATPTDSSFEVYCAQ